MNQYCAGQEEIKNQVRTLVDTTLGTKMAEAASPAQKRVNQGGNGSD